MQDVWQQGDTAHRAREKGLQLLQRVALLFVPDGGGRAARSDERSRGRDQEEDASQGGDGRRGPDRDDGVGMRVWHGDQAGADFDEVRGLSRDAGWEGRSARDGGPGGQVEGEGVGVDVKRFFFTRDWILAFRCWVHKDQEGPFNFVMDAQRGEIGQDFACLLWSPIGGRCMVLLHFTSITVQSFVCEYIGLRLAI